LNEQLQEKEYEIQQFWSIEGIDTELSAVKQHIQHALNEVKLQLNGEGLEEDE
jgi:hypothetical protein